MYTFFTALLGLFTNRNDRVPHLFIYPKPGNGTTFGQSFPAKAIVGITPRDLELLTLGEK